MRYLTLYILIPALFFALAAVPAFAATISTTLVKGNGYNFTSDSQGSAMGGAPWQVTYTEALGNFGAKTIYNMTSGVPFDSVLCPAYGTNATTNYTFNVTPVVGTKFCVYIANQSLNQSYVLLNVTNIAAGPPTVGNISFDWRWANTSPGGGQEGSFQGYALNTSSNPQVGILFNLTLMIFNASNVSNTTYQPCSNDNVSVAGNNSVFTAFNSSFAAIPFPLTLNATGPLGNFTNGIKTISVNVSQPGNYNMIASSSCPGTSSGNLMFNFSGGQGENNSSFTVAGHTKNASNSSQTIPSVPLQINCGGSPSTTTSGGDGSFSFTNVSGTCAINATTPYSGGVTLQVTNNVSGLLLNVTLGGGQQGGNNGSANNVSVHGWVAKQDTTPVSNFTVHFQRTGNCSQGCFGEMATTNGAGYYYKSGLTPGFYTVDGYGPNMPGLPTSNISNGTGGSYLANNTNYTYNITVQDFGGGMQGPSMQCGGNGTISGYVKSVNGTPLSGIMVAANTMMGGPGMGGQGGSQQGGNGTNGSQGGSMNSFCGTSGTSGSDGAYTIQTLKNGTYMMFAHDNNGSYADWQMGFESGGILLANDSSTAEYNITMKRGGRVIGVLYNNGTGNCNASNLTSCPKAGNVFINAIKPSCNNQPDCFGGGTMSDWSNGSFTLSVSPGNYTVSVEANSFLQVGSTTIGTYDINESNTINVSNVFLSAGRKLTGFVLMANGSPITGTWISIMVRQPMGPGQGQGGPGQGGFSGPSLYGNIDTSSGQYNIYGIQAGTWDLEVMPDFNSQYSRKVVSNVVINNSSGNAVLNITLGSGASISGQVNCSGTPVSNGWIMAQDQSSNKFGAGGFDPTSFVGGSIFNGQYSLRGLKAGIYEMHMDLPGSNCAPENAFDVQVADQPVTRNFVLSSGYRLSGRVNTSGGAGVPWAFVNAFIPPTSPGQQPSGFGFAQTNADGNYTISGLKNGTYKVRVEPPYGSGYSAGMGDITMDADKTLNFTLGTGGSIRGRVLDSSGAAVQFAGVNAFSRNAFAFGFSGTSQSGEFTINGLSPGNDYYITVFPPPGSTYGKMSGSIGPKSVSSGTTNVGDITLSAANGTIAGRVLNSVANASGARVHVWAMGQPSWGEATTGIDGTYNISGLSNGAHDVMVEYSTFPPEFASVEVNGSSTPSVNITFNASAPLTLSGYVLDASNLSGISNVNVNIWNETLRAGESATTNGSGYYSMSVKNGSYNIGAFKPSYQFNKSTVSIAADTTRNITLGLLSAVFGGQGGLFNVSGSMLSTSGANAVYNRTVVLAELSNATNSPFILDTITDASGAFAFYNVPVKNYTLVGIIPPNSTKTLNITVTNANLAGQNLTFS